MITEQYCTLHFLTGEDEIAPAAAEMITFSGQWATVCVPCLLHLLVTRRWSPFRQLRPLEN
jgi:hypothetical protein